MVEKVSDFETVIELLGGDAAVATMCGVGVTAVSNWRVRGKLIPSDLYYLFNDALILRHGVVASDRLFSFRRRDQ